MAAATKLEPSKQWVDRYELESMTEPGTFYTVSKKYDDTWACSCSYWKFHKAPKPNCKHILAVIGQVAKPAPKKRQVEVFAEEYFPSPYWYTRMMSKEDVLKFAQAYLEKYAKVEPVVDEVAETVTGEFKITRKFRAV